MTQHFTDIVPGAPANAAIFNAPMLELSDAIDAEVTTEAEAREAADDALDLRIDNIVGYAGTSTVEVVDARTAGNTGSAAASLTARFEWLEGAQNFFAAAYGFDDGESAANNTTALNAAIDAAAATAQAAVVWLPAGDFPINNFTVDANITVRGAAMPRYSRVEEDLIGGTILRGGKITLSDRTALFDLGVIADIDGDAITGGGSDECIVMNVSTMILGQTDPTSPLGHGCIFNSGQRNFVYNYSATGFAHGLVFKGVDNIAANLDFWNCRISCVTIKSDASSDVYGNVINSFRSDGEIENISSVDYYPGGIWVHATTDGDIYDNVISNFYIKNPGHGIYITAHVSSGILCQYNRISNGIIVGPQYNGILIGANNSVDGNGANYNNFVGITVRNAGNYAFVNQYGGSENELHACRQFNSTTGASFGAWRRKDIGVTPTGGLILKLGKSADQTLSTGTSVVDVTWSTEIDDNGMHDTGADTEVFTTFPFAGAYYRIRAVLTFDAHATGQRVVAIARTTTGSWGDDTGYVGYQIVTPGSANLNCQVVCEAFVSAQAAYKWKIQAWQNSGGNLDIDKDMSYVTVELMR